MLLKKLLLFAVITLFADSARGEGVYSTGCQGLFLRRSFEVPRYSQLDSVELSSRELLDTVSAQIPRVIEFQAIRELAREKGVRVWLFGGSASSFLHYVKWDLVTQKGLLDLQRERFDYDFTNIFRSTQDIDLVVDAPPVVALEFQNLIAEKFPHFLGDRANQWEVRTLRYRMGSPGESGFKEALLDDQDFQKQNTDSHSIGMVELSVPIHEEPVVRDLRNWDRNTSLFLADVLKGQITYLESHEHGQTRRALLGENPEILSVIRALVKAFQYELKLQSQDRLRMQRIVDQFDGGAITHPIARKKIETTAEKLVIHAMNLEYAMTTLDELGLRKRLIAMGDPSRYGSFAWWLNREPLRSFPIGQGTGKTAQELGVSLVAHETNHFLSYESINRSHAGSPNVFVSRKNAPGEVAVFGDGFYVTLGDRGSRGTGITIRFQVSPQAREGADFLLLGEIGVETCYVLILNKNAIQVIPEVLEISALDYLQGIASGKKLSQNQQGPIWKLRRKLENGLSSGLIEQEELKKVHELVLKQMTSEAPHWNEVFMEWLSLEGGKLGQGQNDFSDLTTRSYRADPEPIVRKLLRVSQETVLQSWMEGEYLPRLLFGMEWDLGERAIQNAVFSSFPILRQLGYRALQSLLHKRESGYARGLEQIIAEKKDHEVNFDPAIERWLSRGPIEAKAAFISMQSDPQKWVERLPQDELREFYRDFDRFSNFRIYDGLAEKQGLLAQQLFRKESRPESFQFVKFKIPRMGQKFKMGSPMSEVGRLENEKLQEIELTESFEIQMTPLTGFQKVLLLGWDLETLKNSGNRPAASVSWEEAQLIAAKLNELDSKYIYRLPYTKEWEYAARAGTSTAYSFGENSADLEDYGIFLNNSKGGTQDVASRKPNPAGLYDIHGNVWEWCEDEVEGSHGAFRKLRGGSWVNDPKTLRTARFLSASPVTESPMFGMRLIRTHRR